MNARCVYGTIKAELFVSKIEALSYPEYRPSVPIARVVPVTPIPVRELAHQLQAGVSIADINFSEALLIQKCNKSKPSAGLVMPIGGEIVHDESGFAGGLRETGEETTLLSLAQQEAEQAWSTNSSHRSFTFHIPGYDTPRSLQMFVLPVQSRSFSVHEPREGKNGSEDKIARIVSFSPRELRQLVDEGTIMRGDEAIRAAGHFTTANDYSIGISEEDKIVRKEVLNDIVTGVETFETQLRDLTLQEINRVRRIKRTGLADDLAACTQDELVRGFVAAQMRLALADERQRERTHTATPPAKADLLKVANYLTAEELPADIFPELLISTPTREAIYTINRLKRGFMQAANVVVAEVGNLTDDQRKNHPVAALRDAWPKYLKLPLTQRVALITRANEAMIEGLADQMGVPREDIEKAVEATEHFHEFITRSLQRQGDLREAVFQEFRPMNEISNSTLFTRVILALGLHPNVAIAKNHQDEPRIMRFEAMRDLAIFSVALEVTQRLKEADNSVFQAALDTMFIFPPQKQLVDLGDGKLHPVYHRTTALEVDGRPLHVITDERLKKSVLSGVRKLFQNPELLDFYSVNFVLADDNFNEHGDPVEQRLQAAQAFRDTLIGHIQAELDKDPASQWQVSVLPGTYNRTSLDRVQAFVQSGGEDIESIVEENGNGKRAGSKGNAITREKFVLSMQNANGQTQLVEVCIYPFESTRTPSVARLEDAGFWGFAEKLRDDFEGNYEAMRILARDMKHNPTRQSLYELLYPGQLYETLSLKMMDRHVKPRKKGKPSGS